MLIKNRHCVKSVQIRSFFWSEYGKIQTKASYLDTLYAVRYYEKVLDRVVSFEKDTTWN